MKNNEAGKQDGYAYVLKAMRASNCDTMAEERLISLQKQNKELKEAVEYYLKGVGHFFKCINFGKSFMDAEAIQFMNDHELKFRNALHNSKTKEGG